MWLVAYEDIEGRIHTRVFDALDDADSYADVVGGSVHDARIGEQELRELLYGPEGDAI